MAALGFALGLSGPAYGYWSATSTGSYARAEAAALAAPTLTVGTTTATTAALSWNKPFTPTAYELAQSPGVLAGCAAHPSASLTGCTATGLTPGTTYTWTLSAFLHNWMRPASATVTTSRHATTTSLSSLTPTSARLGTSFGAKATVTGYGARAGDVTFGLYRSSTCAGTASTTTTHPAVGGTVTASLTPTTADTYYWKASFAPGDTHNAASTSGCSGPITVRGYFGVGSPTSATSNTTQTVAYPAGTTSGDIVVLVLVNSSKASASSMVSTGWTTLSDTGSLGGHDIRFQAWYHIAGAESGASAAFRTTTAGATAWVLTYKGMGTPTSGQFDDGTRAAAPSMTPANMASTSGARTVISLVGIRSARPLSLSSARDFALRDTEQAGTAAAGRAFGIADHVVPGGVTVTPPTWSQGTSGSLWAYTTVAFTTTN